MKMKWNAGEVKLIFSYNYIKTTTALPSQIILIIVFNKYRYNIYEYVWNWISKNIKNWWMIKQNSVHDSKIKIQNNY